MLGLCSQPRKTMKDYFRLLVIAHLLSVFFFGIGGILGFLNPWIAVVLWGLASLAALFGLLVWFVPLIKRQVDNTKQCTFCLEYFVDFDGKGVCPECEEKQVG